MGWSSEIILPSGACERAVQIPVSQTSVRGNLILPPSSGEMGAVLVHGWGGIRSGPHNLMTSLARFLGEMAIPSLRFDLRGRGESGGGAMNTTLVTMAEDALAAVAFLKKTTNVRRILLIGICSGGNVGIGILDRCPEVDALFLMSVYPFGNDDSFKRDAQRTVHHLKEYWRKLWMPHTWRKLLRGQIDFNAVCAILIKPIRRRLRDSSAVKDAEETGAPASSPLENLLRRRPKMKMVYGEADPEFVVSRDYYQNFAEKHDYPISMTSIAGANHNFYATAWMKRLKSELRTFVEGM